MESIINTFASVLLGGLLTWIAARHYYQRAGKELLLESKKLKQASDLILYKLQYPDTPTHIKRNESGDAVGLIVDMKGKA